MSTIRKRLSGTAAAISAALVLSACATVRERPVTEIQVPAEYGLGDSEKNQPTEDLYISITPIPAYIAENAWWQQFADARLNRLVDTVLRVNTDLAVAGLRLKQSRLIAGLATDALRPHLDAAVGSSYDKQLKTGNSSERINSLTASISYEADLWGRLRAQRDVATWEAEATEEDLQITRLVLIGDTCNLYWTLAFLNLRIATGEQSLARLERTRSFVQSQLRAGAVSRLETQEAEQNFETQKTLQSQLIQQRVETHNALTVLLDGQPWPQSEEPKDLSGARTPEIRPGIPAEILARRPDLRAAELRLRAALKNTKVIQTSYYPPIVLTSSVAGTSSALGNVLANPVGTLGADILFPFLRWNEMKLNAELAGTDYEIFAVDFRNMLYTALTEVDNALSARVELRKQLESSQKSYDAAVEIERLYEVRYRAGAASLRIWLDAQETRRSAELVLVQTKLNQLQNDVRLFQALGGGA